MKKLFFPAQKQEASIPCHVAMIMDGNGRWAKRRHLPRTAGHKTGAETVRRMIEACIEQQVQYLTLYAFSSENWQRSSEEVNDLMALLRFYLEKELSSLHEQGVQVRIIGDRTRLAEDIQQRISHAEELTQGNTKLTLAIALSYGSHHEIVHAAKCLAQKALDGMIELEKIDQDMLEAELYTAGMPAPDLLIRTGGEQRLSNFLLWQSAYAELYFTEILWPDFSKEDFAAALDEYATRERRYGTA